MKKFVKSDFSKKERSSGTFCYSSVQELPEASLTSIIGVGTLTAMVFLTEMGDLNRFPNRRKLKAYVGLAPTSHESGEIKDRKGHIARRGSSRLRVHGTTGPVNVASRARCAARVRTKECIAVGSNARLSRKNSYLRTVIRRGTIDESLACNTAVVKFDLP